MSEQTPDEPYPYITAHVAKLAFRGLLPIFARIWSQAREAAPQGSLNKALWPDYERVLRACQDVLSHAPMHPNEAKQIDLETRFTLSIERLATTLAEVFPSGLHELENFIVTDALRATRRKHDLTRYRNTITQQRNGRRRHK